MDLLWILPALVATGTVTVYAIGRVMAGFDRVAAERDQARGERDAAYDALAAVADASDWGCDSSDLAALARQALATSDYHGRLRGALEATEQVWAENVELRARLAADQDAQRAALEAAMAEDVDGNS